MTSDDGTARPRKRMLDELAAALGIPAAAFFADPEDGHRMADSVELLNLWAALDRPEQRRELLAHLRRMMDAPPAG